MPDEDYYISGPPFDLVFSAVDQVTPPIYSRRVLIFSQPHQRRDETITILRTGLQRTVNDIPILAGQMGLATSGWTVKKGLLRLRVHDMPMKYDELLASGFSESLLPAAVVSSVPSISDPEEQWHSCRIQANFIEKGLLLVVSIMHTTMDGYGISKVIESLARNCRKDDSLLGNWPNSPEDRSVLSRSSGPGDIDKLRAYSIVTDAAAKFPAVASEVVTMTCRLTLEALKQVKSDATSPQRAWITTHDALNALCWRIHARTRRHYGLISDSDTARFAFPVEFRRLLQPPLPASYIGNAVLMNTVSLPVSTLLGPNGLREAASAIRAGIQEVDADYVENFIAVVKGLEDPRQMRINLKLESPATGFGSTSYKSFAHGSLNWDADALGEFNRMRLSYGVTGEGMSIILPVLNDASWEVTVTVEKAHRDRFSKDEECIKYTQSCN